LNVHYKRRQIRKIYQAHTTTLQHSNSNTTKDTNYKWHKYTKQHNNKCNRSTSVEDFLSKKGKGSENQPRNEPKNGGKKNIKESGKQQLIENQTSSKNLLLDLNREISETIKKDIRRYKNEKII